jgi:hypothetical protein
LTLSIRYREVPSSPQTILRGGACHQTGHCEPSRTQESFAFEWLSDPVDPDRRRVEDFCTSYEACADVIDRFASIVHSDDGLAKFKQWYRSRIASLPVHHFPILDDFISNLDEDRAQIFARELPNNPEAMLILVLIVQECRFNLLRKLEETCYACDPNRGVPLARVRLSPGASGRMKVAMVEPFPPFRRSLRLDDCWPVCPGTWNLGRFIWQPVPDVCIALRELGFHVTSQVLGAGNMHLLAHPPIVGCGTGKSDCCPPESPNFDTESISLCVTWIDSRDGSHRVVAIAPGPCLQQQPAKKNPAPRSKPADRQATPRPDQGPIR